MRTYALLRPFMILAAGLVACSSGDDGSSSGGGGTGAGPGSGGAGGAPSTTKLPVDCRDSSTTDARCKTGSDAPPKTVGKGPNNDYYAYAGGYVDQPNNRLVVAFGCDLCTDGDTGVMAIDLTTGDRTLLSGAVNDTITGPQSVGMGDALTSINDVHVAPNGKWWVLDSASIGAEIHEIDPATGDRTAVLYTQDQFDFTATPICTIGTTGLQVGWDTVGNGATDALANMIVHPDGKIYMRAVGPFGDPLAIVELDQGTCRVVTSSSSDPASNVGNGPTIRESYGWLTERKGALIGSINYAYLHSIDIATGNRTMLSSADQNAMLGMGTELGAGFLAVAPDGDTILNSGPINHLIFGGIISINPTTGDRTKTDAEGPQRNAEAANIIPHPTLDGVYIMPGAGQVTLFEPATGNSMLLSR